MLQNTKRGSECTEHSGNTFFLMLLVYMWYWIFLLKRKKKASEEERSVSWICFEVEEYWQADIKLKDDKVALVFGGILGMYISVNTILMFYGIIFRCMNSYVKIIE